MVKRVEWIQFPDKIQTEELKNSYEIIFFLGLVIIFNLLESMIPHPVPWFRLGWGNVIIIWLVVRYGLKTALSVALIKVLVTSLLLGKFLTPSFFMALSGSLLSVVMMYLVYTHANRVFSIFGISIIGACFHNLGQFMVMFFIFDFNTALFLQVPALSLWSVISGMIVAFIYKILVNYKILFQIEEIQ